MTWLAFVLILLSAMLHAAWNLIAKKNTMTVPFYTILCIMGALVWLHVQFWTPVAVWSLPLKFWLMIAGTITFDVLYCFSLVLIYRKMEMATAYPMMRSLPILLTVLTTAVFGLGSAIGWVRGIGFMVVFAGALLMPLRNFSQMKLSTYLNWKMFYVLLAACGTTGYTVFDSQGVKIIRSLYSDVSAVTVSLTYYSTRALLLSTTLCICCCFMAEARKVFRDYWEKRNFYPVLAACCSSSTYILVLIAMNYVTNVSYVQVCRQFGLPLGMLAGILILKEKSAVIKWVGVSLILVGFAISFLG
ncbi:MAG: hypothetical protein IKB71_08295 [Lentisphaeria bacterium]|nr:hypothetical protein [Lentisphaeria bacterium]